MTRLQRFHAIKAWRVRQPLRSIEWQFDYMNEAALIPLSPALAAWLNDIVARPPRYAKETSHGTIGDQRVHF